MKKVEFISYDKENNIAVYLINGREVRFGRTYHNDVDVDGECNSYPIFWEFDDKNNCYNLATWWIIAPDVPAFIINNIVECLKQFNLNVNDVKTNSYFSNMCFLEYGNKKFLVDKFLGFDAVDFRYKIGGDKIHIQYFMNIYFSGEKLELSKTCTIPTHHKYPSRCWSIFNEETDEFKFICRYGKNGNNLYEQFKKSPFKSVNKSDVISDYVKWFAGNTSTEVILNELKKDINFCFGYIDKHYNKGNK